MTQAITPGRQASAPDDLRHPSLYINRELSWLEFNRRVLHEAQDPRTPLLERLKFLAIYSSNLDEFFQVRVAGLRQQAGAGRERTADGLTPGPAAGIAPWSGAAGPTGCLLRCSRHSRTRIPR
jgi:polyphosphate kinase